MQKAVVTSGSTSYPTTRTKKISPTISLTHKEVVANNEGKKRELIGLVQEAVQKNKNTTTLKEIVSENKSVFGNLRYYDSRGRQDYIDRMLDILGAPKELLGASS